MPPNIVTDRIVSSSVITEDEFQDMVKKGDKLFIYESKVYKVNNFLKKHPGGEATIASALGRDVTDEIRSLHPPQVYEKMINLYCIGDYLPSLKKKPQKTKKLSSPSQDIEWKWNGDISFKAYDDSLDEVYALHKKELNKDDNVHDKEEIREAYRQLEQKIKQRGLFHCNYWKYAQEGCRYVLFLFLALWFTLKGTAFWHYMVGASFLALFWHQLTFAAHDAGHNGITGNSNIDHVIGVLLADFIGGLSIGWWKDNHNVHHIVTNHPEHDPDIQHLPFFAITTQFFKNLYSTYYKRILPFDPFSSFFIQYQHYLYYLVLSFGRFNLHRLSFIYLASDKHVRTRKFEITGIIFYFVWYTKLLSTLPTWNIRLCYFLVSYMLTFPLHIQITLSHFGMSTEDRGPNEPFAAKMLRTTMDVDCPEWLDWVHGGLQYQAVHHLFPRIPRHNLRECVPLVKQFCKENGLQYYVYNFTTGNGVVLGTLKSVADQVQFMNKVAKSNATVWSKEH